MRIAIYSSPIYTIVKPTGVGRHIGSMATELCRLDGVDPVLLANRQSYAQVQPHLNGLLSGVPIRYIPGPERWMRAMLLGTRLAGVERWAGEVDWVYCPKEQPVATSRACLAVTVHDVLPFETDVFGLPRMTRWARTRWRMTMSQILRRADLIATVSDFTRDRLLSLFDVPDESRIRVVGNGVAPMFFRTPQPDDERVLGAYDVAAHRYVVTVGSLTHRKNGTALLRLAERLHAEGAGVEILVAGRRHDRDLVERFRERKERNPQLPIRLLGYISDEDLTVLLSHALAMLFPSRYEGFGIPAVEAMAAGAPVIASRAGALPEVLGGAGFEIDGEDDQIMFEAIEQLAHDDGRRRQLIESGRRRAAAFTWRRCAERLVSAMKGDGADVAV